MGSSEVNCRITAQHKEYFSKYKFVLSCLGSVWKQLWISQFTYVQMFKGFGSKMINVLQKLGIHCNQFSILPESFQKARKEKLFQKLIASKL